MGEKNDPFVYMLVAWFPNLHLRSKAMIISSMVAVEVLEGADIFG